MMKILRSSFATTSGRHQLCRRIIAGSGLLLIAATWRLWFSSGEFPQIPFFEVLCAVPQVVDWFLSALLVLSLAGMLVTKADLSRNLAAGCLVIVLLVALIALNQHRLQPWAWFLILATVATSARADYALTSLRLLLFGVYLFSALSKLEPSFVGGGGDWLLDGLFAPFGHSSASFSAESRRILLFLMPVTELLAALFVLHPRLRTPALFLVLGMHGTLLLALGPFGLDHKPGVLLWNATFLVLAFPLLWRARTAEPVESDRRSAWFRVAVFGGAIVLPVFGQRWMPIVDQWPSWSVYATWHEPMKLSVQGWNVDSLRKDVREHVDLWTDHHRFELESFPLRLDRWSLEATGAPIYPQNRFRVGVCLKLLEDVGAEGAGGEWDMGPVSGERTPVFLTGYMPLARIRENTRRYWINTKAREGSFFGRSKP